MIISGNSGINSINKVYGADSVKSGKSIRTSAGSGSSRSDEVVLSSEAQGLQQQIAAKNQVQAGASQAQQLVAAAAQRTVNVVQQTQTFQAPQAAGQSEASRESKSSSGTGPATDTTANTLNAVASRSAAGRQGRGFQLDVSV